MPLPKPKNKEKKSEFVSRCIGDTQTNKDFPDQKQRIAVCYSQWDKSKKEAAASVELNNDEFLLFSNVECQECDKALGSEEEVTDQIEAQEASKKLNKPFRTPGGPKKFSVYVKNDKGNIVKVNFGSPEMEIKRDDPKRRKSFRARHRCDNPGPKWRARYWACKTWEAGKTVEDVVG